MVYSGPVEELGYGRTCDNQKKMSISSQLINVLILKVTLAYAQNIFPTSPPKQVNLIVQWIRYKYTNTGPLFTPGNGSNQPVIFHLKKLSTPYFIFKVLISKGIYASIT